MAGIVEFLPSPEPQVADSRHSTSCPSFSTGRGVSWAQRGSASGQRGWKRQPGGMLAGIRHACRPAPHPAGRARAPASAPRPAAPGCRGGAACANSAAGRRALDDAAEIHHRDLARDMLHHRQVVADEHAGEVELLPQLRQQVEDLRLHRDVERARSARRTPRCAAAAPARARSRPAGAGRRTAAPAAASAMLRRQPDARQHLGHPRRDLGATRSALRHAAAGRRCRARGGAD